LPDRTRDGVDVPGPPATAPSRSRFGHVTFPDTYEAIAELAGVGEYTAAAIASIAFELPHAAVDGNVLRVISRLYNDDSDIANPSVKKRFAELAGALLDRRRPGDFNQAMMELGATVCLPRAPQCLLCPLLTECEARSAGRQNELPVKRRPKATVRLERAVLVIRRRGAILMRQRDAGASLMAGFWELPERGDLPDAVEGEVIGNFRHAITHHQYRYAVVVASLRKAPQGCRWVSPANLKELPVATITRKALGILERASEE
jgi:A/G-specific adenine glycosylase